MTPSGITIRGVIILVNPTLICGNSQYFDQFRTMSLAKIFVFANSNAYNTTEMSKCDDICIKFYISIWKHSDFFHKYISKSVITFFLSMESSLTNYIPTTVSLPSTLHSSLHPSPSPTSPPFPFRKAWLQDTTTKYDKIRCRQTREKSSYRSW